MSNAKSISRSIGKKDGVGNWVFSSGLLSNSEMHVDTPCLFNSEFESSKEMNSYEFEFLKMKRAEKLSRDSLSDINNEESR